MLFKANKGQIKDGCMIYNNGIFYLFSMYHKENSDKFNNIHLATSEDGVHFEDRGCVVEDFPCFIWAMKVYRGEDAFYMNSGSFNKDGKQSVLKFWKSFDLVNWEYMENLDIESPEVSNGRTRLDCMNVVKKDGKYYGYATGQYGFMVSDDGERWNLHPSNIDYSPFPEYNNALGGFELADALFINGKFYIFCGGFGHLGTNGYGVYIYESENPEGPFRPSLPNYRINGTSKRWVNMWERFFEYNGEYLAHNYSYDGYSYENGDVYLPPIKKLKKENDKLFLAWWENNDKLYRGLLKEKENLFAKAESISVFDDDTKCELSEKIDIPDKCIIEFNLTLSKNTFTEYSKGGIYLGEDENTGTALLFDTYGKFEISYVKNKEIVFTDDTVGFGSTAPYYLASGKTYSVKILHNNGLFEIYVDNLYLQTFNNAHFKGDRSRAFNFISAAASRKECSIADIKIYGMTI